MNIISSIDQNPQKHQIRVCSNGLEQQLFLPSKQSGAGSAVNGGELISLALATCFCNDIYREAAKKNISITRVTVRVEGDFSGEGLPSGPIRYYANLEGDASDDDLCALAKHTDTDAEVQNTIRAGVRVTFGS